MVEYYRFMFLSIIKPVPGYLKIYVMRIIGQNLLGWPRRLNISAAFTFTSVAIALNGHSS